MKSPSEIVLNALMRGASFHHDDWEIAMGENYDVGYVMTNQDTGEQTVCGDITVGQFIRMCEKLTDEELISIGFSSRTRGDLFDIMKGRKHEGI